MKRSAFLQQLLVLVVILLRKSCSSSFTPIQTGICADPMTTLGGLQQDSTSNSSTDVDSLGRFAVEEHNKKENSLVKFVRVVQAQEQVVAGTLHHLTLEAEDAGKKKLYEANVWVKPWMNFKELQEFKHTGDATTFTRSDLGVKKDDRGSGSREVPVQDPIVQDAANYAVKTIQQRSNSLFPYELQEIIHAKAEEGDEFVKFDMLLRVHRGEKEEHFKIEVHKRNDGAFHLNQMEQHTS